MLAKERWSGLCNLSPDDSEANYSLGMVFAQLDDSERAYPISERR